MRLCLCVDVWFCHNFVKVVLFCCVAGVWLVYTGSPGSPGEPGRPGRDGFPGPKVSPYCNPFASKSPVPSKHAGSNLEAFRLQPVIAITASMQPEFDRIVYAGSHFLPSKLVLFFQRRPRSHYAEPIRFQSGWPGQVLGKCILLGSKMECKNQSHLVSGRTQPACCQFLTFRLGSVLPQTSWIVSYCGKTSLGPIGSWLTLRFGPNGSGLEARWCTRTIWPTSGQHFWSQSGSDADQIWHVHWVHCYSLILHNGKSQHVAIRAFMLADCNVLSCVIIIPGLTWMLLNALVVALADPSVLSFLDLCTCKQIIVIKKFCKAPTQQFKALNKHYITHIMHIKVENVICKLSNS